MLSSRPIAVFFQSKPAPEVDGIKKPFKPSGYLDSSADIASCLRERKFLSSLPVSDPKGEKDSEWSFPDDTAGIQRAYDLGARVFWMNTVLYSGHPFETLNLPDVSFVGQKADLVQKFDDKFFTSELLRTHGLPVAKSRLVSLADWKSVADEPIPFVVKPVRGRGSQGVSVVHHLPWLEK